MADTTGRHLTAEHPSDADISVGPPDTGHDEATHLLANEAREVLHRDHFTDEEVFEWAAAYLAVEGGGDLAGLLVFIDTEEHPGSARSPW